MIEKSELINKIREIYANAKEDYGESKDIRDIYAFLGVKDTLEEIMKFIGEEL